MKSRIRPAALLASMLMISTLSLTGCAMFGRGEPRMTATLQSVQDDFNQAELEAEETQDALIELEYSDIADLKQAFEAFSESADNLLWTGEHLIIHADEMHFQGDSYLVESEVSATACVYPRLRRPEDKTVADLGPYFDAIADQSWDVKRAWRAYQFDISQIEYSLSANLTPVKVQAITTIFQKAKVDGVSLKESLEQALANIEAAKAAKAAKAQTPAGPVRQ